ncbi:glycerophosphodiester phosphodiesterase GDPDL4-like isoform X2 [Telopea speciosissima]|uniref:glycerophosphodiester phosphodiesterase GDPDL4-like isoform X2 n=1 Tax=Telopea speciosissima TaxID=54955 RepID=UPI001CC6A86D|nr:glycerophosphodiester phosphodiesterase GDPDL4-like isoform X2 [Telopea speciosissima]
MPILRSLLLLLVLHSALLVSAKRSKATTSLWQTLSGNAPLVVARGGFSGMFPDSSYGAYSLALMTSLSDVILWCDVQLTKDGAGICFPSLNLANSSSILNFFRNSSVYSVDYTLNDLFNVSLTQGIYSRTNKFDGNMYSILTVEDVVSQFKPPGLWLNIQNDGFFRQHNLSMRSFVLSVSKRVIVNYVSSPEVGFLSSIASRIGTKTKLVFRFLEKDDTEPSTNQTYGSLLSNLTFVKTFASGILVPKAYIWPVNNLYLQSPTSVVSDAHNEGLEVFASDFANDAVLSYNYSYDPVAEYLSFIDNGNFSVDGVLSDFPITPSEAIDCFSHISKNGTGQAPPVVITHNGASGVYPGCTNVAYQQAVKDGADVIDCSVQMTSDGIPICLGSINLIEGTAVAQSPYSNRSARIPELQKTPGIFTFSLTWKEIQALSPAISNPYLDYRLYRYPAHRNQGNLFSLDDFLTFAKTNPLSGVLISVENAAYLAEYQGLSVIDAVFDSLDKSGYNNQTIQKVMIQSTNSSVLKVFKEKTSYELVYQVDETIRDALNSSIEGIKGFAHSVSLTKETIFPENQALFLTGATEIVKKLQSYKISVYVNLFTNEFVSQAWDFFSDPMVEINTFVSSANIDGVVTEFPGTAISYRKNKCLNMGNNRPSYMSPVQPAGLLQVITTPYLPPAEAPNPVLTDADVIEPPLPSLVQKKPTSEAGGPATSPTAAIRAPNGQPRNASSFFLSYFVVLLAFLLF